MLDDPGAALCGPLLLKRETHGKITHTQENRPAKTQ